MTELRDRYCLAVRTLCVVRVICLRHCRSVDCLACFITGCRCRFRCHCRLYGLFVLSKLILQTIQDELGISDGQTTKDGLFSLKCVACLGCCSLSPVMMVNEDTYGSLTPDKTKKILKELREAAQ
ncbi:MAG: NAD(P)H-dependent oxidoreductase subunit E [Ruminococcus sp.]|nr:NAD(P)H-dependent oxidoreductase subunit E [Ruminococcus sp.]